MFCRVLRLGYITYSRKQSKQDTDVAIYKNMEGKQMGIGLNGLNSGMQDMYSSLLGGTGSSASGSSTLLSDYASIKNGSYGKMMKAYYAKVGEEETESSSKSDSKTKETDGATASAARRFYETASGMNSLDYSEENIDGLYDSVSAFIKDYNTMIKNASNSKLDDVKKQADAINDLTYSNYKLLARVGITMNSDRTLSIDEDTFKKVNEKTGATNVPTLKTLFQGYGSYADKLTDKMSKLYRTAGEGESVTSSKAKYAGSAGSYTPTDKTDDTDETKAAPGSSKTAKDSASAAAASALYKSIDKMGSMQIDNDNKDNIFEAFNTFIKDYNSLMKNALESVNSNVIHQADYLRNLVNGNKSAFARMGITVNGDNTLSIDEEKFKDSDMSNVKDLFTGAYSFSEKMTDRINQIYKYATQGGTLADQTYTSQGTYSAGEAGTVLDTTM